MIRALVLGLLLTTPASAQVVFCDPDTTVFLNSAEDNETVTLFWDPVNAISSSIDVVRDGVVVDTIPATTTVWSEIPPGGGVFTYHLEDPACGFVSYLAHTYAATDVAVTCSSTSAAPGETFSVDVTLSSSVPFSGASIGVEITSGASSTLAFPSLEVLGTAPQFLMFHGEPGGPTDGWIVMWLDTFDPGLSVPLAPGTEIPIATLEGVVDPGAAVGTEIELRLTGVTGPGVFTSVPGIVGVSAAQGSRLVPAHGQVTDGAVLVTGASFRRGDVNGSGGVGIDDVIFLLEWMMELGPEPGCIAAMDVLGDGADPILAEALTLLMAIHDPNAPDPVAGCDVHPLEGLTCDDPGGCP